MPDMERVMRSLKVHLASTEEERAYLLGYHQGLSQARYEVALILIGLALGWSLLRLPPGLLSLLSIVAAMLAVYCARLLRGEIRAPEYRTVDGGHLAPHPGMTDSDLHEFEVAMNVPNRTFSIPPCAKS